MDVHLHGGGTAHVTLLYTNTKAHGYTRLGFPVYSYSLDLTAAVAVLGRYTL